VSLSVTLSLSMRLKKNKRMPRFLTYPHVNQNQNRLFNVFSDLHAMSSAQPGKEVFFKTSCKRERDRDGVREGGREMEREGERWREREREGERGREIERDGERWRDRER
jgi:hypothetical protein